MGKPTLAMKTLVQRLALYCFTSLILLVAAVGCKHTADGVGDDIEKAGDEIEDALD